MPSAEVTLIRGGGGNFIVTADSKVMWHKRQMADQFPDEAALVEKLQRA